MVHNGTIGTVLGEKFQMKESASVHLGPITGLKKRKRNEVKW